MSTIAPAARSGATRSPWRERWLNWRNRIIAEPAFQRFAASNIFTRGVARRKTRALFDLCAGFVYSQILLACVELDVFETLREGPRSLDELAQRFALPRERASRLLRAAQSLRLLDALPDETYALGDLGAAMLGNPSIAAFVEHHKLLYDDLREPVALLRGADKTRLSEFWPYAAAAPQNVAAYSALMARSRAMS